jgi:multiple sugar transport system permease protein
MFLFWKTLYRPRGGLINAVLDPALDTIQSIITSTPRFLWYTLGTAIFAAAVIWAFALLRSGINKLVNKDAGPAAFIGRTALVLTMLITAYAFGAVLVQAPQQSLLRSGYSHLDRAQSQTIADALAAEFPGADTAELNLIVTNVAGSSPDVAARSFAAALPDGALARARTLARAQSKPLHDGLTSGDGLTAPEWLLSPSWAKTAIVVMGIWTVVGGANMLLYLAGLSNIPPELYEAADIDGASGWQRFVHVTWPQLAPTTFFIVVMSVIGGVQGGFEQAMVMTEGKADTITLSYYLYNVGFTDRFELGLACAIAWVMFAMIFVLTLFNFRVGNQLTND